MGRSIPVTILSVVDLPAPLGPSRPYTRPSPTCRLTPSTAICARLPRPNRFVSPRVSNTYAMRASIPRITYLQFLG